MSPDTFNKILATSFLSLFLYYQTHQDNNAYTMTYALNDIILAKLEAVGT